MCNFENCAGPTWFLMAPLWSSKKKKKATVHRAFSSEMADTDPTLLVPEPGVPLETALDHRGAIRNRV